MTELAEVLSIVAPIASELSVTMPDNVDKICSEMQKVRNKGYILDFDAVTHEELLDATRRLTTEKMNKKYGIAELNVQDLVYELKSAGFDHNTIKVLDEVNELSESKSRYSIMEEFNQKKINAQSRMANIKKEMKEKDNKHKFELQKFDLNIENETHNFEMNHEHKVTNMTDSFETWKNGKNYAIGLITREIERKEENFKEVIDKENENYKDEHEKRLAELEENKSNTIENYNTLMELKDMDIEAIVDEMAEIDKAITSLQDLSSGTEKAK